MSEFGPKTDAAVDEAALGETSNVYLEIVEEVARQRRDFTPLKRLISTFEGGVFTLREAAACLQALEEENYVVVGRFSKKARMPMQRDLLLSFLEEMNGELDPAVNHILHGVRTGAFLKMNDALSCESREYLVALRNDPSLLSVEMQQQDEENAAEDL